MTPSKNLCSSLNFFEHNITGVSGKLASLVGSRLRLEDMMEVTVEGEAEERRQVRTWAGCITSGWPGVGFVFGFRQIISTTQLKHASIFFFFVDCLDKGGKKCILFVFVITEAPLA